MRVLSFLVIAVMSWSIAGSSQAQSILCQPPKGLSCYTDHGCHKQGCCRPLWDVSVGAAILHRSTPQPSILIETWDQSQTLFNAGAFQFDWNTGPDIQVVRRVDKSNRFDAIGVRYFGVESWQANTSTAVTGIWRFPSSPGVFALDARIDAGYESELHSLEIHLLRDSSSHGRWTWLAGFRWLQLNERMHMDVYDFNVSAYVGDYIYTTKNNLFGGQIGAEAKILDRERFWIDGFAKAGIYGNVASNRYLLIDETGTHPFSNDQQDQVAFVGDLGLTATYQCTKHLALQGGYQLLWIQGVAIAGDQAVAIDLSTDKGIHSRGGAFYHGALVSANLTW